MNNKFVCKFPISCILVICVSLVCLYGNTIPTSPCPLQRGICANYPPLEGAGGGRGIKKVRDVRNSHTAHITQNSVPKVFERTVQIPRPEGYLTKQIKIWNPVPDTPHKSNAGYQKHNGRYKGGGGKWLLFT